MKNFLKEHGLWVLFAAAVIAVVLAVMSVLSYTSSPLVNAANTVAAPFRAAYTAVADWFNDKQNYYRDTTALEEENAALRRRLRELGLCDGAKVTCTFQGAHRDIAVYKICGAQIAVRDCDAQHVWVLAEVAE